MNKLFASSLAIGVVGFISLPLSALDWTDKVSLTGFASANFHQTDDAAPFNGESGNGHDNQGSYAGTRFGLNVRAKVNDTFSFASQLFATKEEDNYAAHVDWAFGTMHLSENVDFRAGKLKFPVGLVNEYADVGYAYPWLHAPAAFYSGMGAPNGPQVTRESYTGASLLWEIPTDDWIFSVDFYDGEVNLEGTNVRQLGGMTFKADWNDEVLFQLSSYKGNMRDVEIEGNPIMSALMEGAQHKANTFAVKVDIDNYLGMFEIADVEMGDINAMSASTWYMTLGYRINDFLPFVTIENYEQGEPVDDDQKITTLGLRWDVLSDVAVKFEISRIKLNRGLGLFTSQPEGDTVNMIGFGIDTVF